MRPWIRCRTLHTNTNQHQRPTTTRTSTGMRTMNETAPASTQLLPLPSPSSTGSSNHALCVGGRRPAAKPPYVSSVAFVCLWQRSCCRGCVSPVPNKQATAFLSPASLCHWQCALISCFCCQQRRLSGGGSQIEPITSVLFSLGMMWNWPVLATLPIPVHNGLEKSNNQPKSLQRIQYLPWKPIDEVAGEGCHYLMKIDFFISSYLVPMN
jgi:hypothetical protein